MRVVIDFAKAPADLSILEVIILVRNRVQQPDDCDPENKILTR